MPPSLPSPQKTLRHTPLTQHSFSAFGTVIETPDLHPQHLGHPSLNPETVLANQNTAIKKPNVSNMCNNYAQSPSQTPAKAVLNLFSCFPRTLTRSQPGEDNVAAPPSIFPIQILERHPFTTQTFVPMGLAANDPSAKYLVIVAPTLLSPTGDFPDPGRGPPDLENVRAFLAHGGQAVTYGPGTWHSPMVVVGEKRVDFVVVQFLNGVEGEDCEEVGVEGGGFGVEVEVGK